jgi:ketosteroid isomerase-like protein
LSLRGADSWAVDARSKSELQAQREARFVQDIGAFVRRDFEAIDRKMHSDVVMHLPGSSWLAGTYTGFEEVGRCILGLRHVLDSSEDRVTFLHEGDQMIVRHDIRVHGPKHQVDMTLLVRVRFGAEGKAESMSVEPADLGLFDHVLNVAPKDSAAS